MIVLEKLREEDLPLILIWRKQEEYTNKKIELHYNYQSLDFQNTWFNNICKNKSCKYWIIKSGAIKIGIADINHIDYEEKKCDIECHIGDMHFKNRGIKSIVVYNLYEYAFKELNIKEVCRNIKDNDEEIFGFEKDHLKTTKISGNIKDIKCIKIKSFDWQKIKMESLNEKININ